MVGFLQENNRSVLEVYQIKRKHTLFCWFKSLMSYSLDLQSALTETTWIKLSIAYQNNNMNKTKLNPPDTQHQLPCTNWTCIQCWLTIQRWRNEQTHLLFYLLISRTFKKIFIKWKADIWPVQQVFTLYLRIQLDYQGWMFRLRASSSFPKSFSLLVSDLGQHGLYVEIETVAMDCASIFSLILL